MSFFYELAGRKAAENIRLQLIADCKRFYDVFDEEQLFACGGGGDFFKQLSRGNDRAYVAVVDCGFEVLFCGEVVDVDGYFACEDGGEIGKGGGY